MGASLYYRPVNPKSATCFTGGSTLHRILESRFGTFPVSITKEQLKELETMVACGYPEVDKLADAVERYGEVELTVTY